MRISPSDLHRSQSWPHIFLRADPSSTSHNGQTDAATWFAAFIISSLLVARQVSRSDRAESNTINTISKMVLIHCEILKKHGQQWKLTTEDLEDYLAAAPPKDPKEPRFLFANSDILKREDAISQSLRQKLQIFYRMPPEIWSEVHWESNGYFGCNDEGRDRHDTWSRFLVKQLSKRLDGLPFPENYSYEWYKLGFFSTWSQSEHKSVLCLDCPRLLIDNIITSLENSNPDHFAVDPYAFYQIILRGVVNLFDNSVWALRHVVRKMEKAGIITEGSNSDELERVRVRSMEQKYELLHEAARHVIHSTETLLVATDITAKIMDRQKDRMINIANLPEESRICMTQVCDNIRFYHGMLYAFRCRSESIQARNQNEIAMAFNTVAQHHSKAAVDDAAAMKVIAALTVAFLPATFVSAVFSTSFFNNGGSNGGQAGEAGGGSDEWSYSDKFWIYWAFAIPLTILTIVCLYFMLRKSNRV
ncbi:hypothetical protein ABW19_dt0210192 [Dactylella cylindrospora]|nr:hypothetical protein ABW19_dt0210192 [Dactylella cylindrospora]